LVLKNIIDLNFSSEKKVKTCNVLYKNQRYIR